MRAPAAEVLRDAARNQHQGESFEKALSRAVKKAQGVRVGRPATLPATIVRRIRRERARGKSFAAIAEGLNADRVPTAQGGRRCYPATVRSIVLRTS